MIWQVAAIDCKSFSQKSGRLTQLRPSFAADAVRSPAEHAISEIRNFQARVLAGMKPPARPSRRAGLPRSRAALPRRRIDHYVDPSRPHEKQYRLRDERVLL